MEHSQLPQTPQTPLILIHPPQEQIPPKDPKTRRAGARWNQRWSHLWPNIPNEAHLIALHSLAQKIGLKKEWFQDRPGFPHYDLTAGKYPAALQAGAKVTCLRTWLKEKRKNTHEI